MNRSVFVLLGGFLLVVLCGLASANAAFWAGPKGVYFYPLNSGLHSYFRPYWGAGAEGGWLFRKHFELGAEGFYIRARSKEDMEQINGSGNIIGTFHDENDFLILSPRFSWRFLSGSTPFLGFGLGYYRATWRLVGLKQSDFFEAFPTSFSHSALGTCLFAGYDYRIRRWFGLRAEGGLQVARANVPNSGYQWVYGDMGGWKASLGSYLAW